ncbi:NAD-dependent epimerase/dehydratase family protein [Inquilinus sp. OTU3971]|uniref:NAD-dependent epimerase/dehydratase family protein n=1 Tax=Inquilinus sp. OTU3971 TaxID=3043855 RepID=UPI00313D6B37
MRVFVTGATGYIGHAVAAGFVRSGHTVHGLVRSEAGRETLLAAGAQPIMGTLDDADLLRDEARAADIVVQAADADHPRSISALLDGVRGRKAVFMHTSGTGIYADAADGEPSSSVNDETVVPDLTDHKIGRWNSERAVLEAAQGDTRTIVIRPSMAYGGGRSIQIPLIIDISKATGAGRYLGRGENRWSNVHIDDLADLYLLAAEKAPSGSLYNVASGEEGIRTIAQSVSRMLGFGGRTQSMTVAEGVAFRGFDFWWIDLASNSRVISTKARNELGWAPSRPGILHDIEFGSYADLHRPAAVAEGA